jgi:hypothetical protein
MKYRKLRIAWSVAFGIPCVLLIALWVRSYWIIEVITIPVASSRAVAMGSISGSVALSVLNSPSPWKTARIPANEWEIMVKFGALKFPSPVWGGLLRTPDVTVLLIPCWMLIALSATLAVAPWMRWTWRFSLRTLLIATTLVAIVLGLVVYAVRN